MNAIEKELTAIQVALFGAENTVSPVRQPLGAMTYPSLGRWACAECPQAQIPCVYRWSISWIYDKKTEGDADTWHNISTFALGTRRCWNEVFAHRNTTARVRKQIKWEAKSEDEDKLCDKGLLAIYDVSFLMCLDIINQTIRFIRQNREWQII